MPQRYIEGVTGKPEAGLGSDGEVADPGSVGGEDDDGADVEIVFQQGERGDQERCLLLWPVGSTSEEDDAGLGVLAHYEELAEVGVDRNDAASISAGSGHDVGVRNAEQVQIAHVDGVVAGGDQQRGDAR
jgi:hypothetical protein